MDGTQQPMPISSRAHARRATPLAALPPLVSPRAERIGCRCARAHGCPHGCNRSPGMARHWPGPALARHWPGAALVRRGTATLETALARHGGYAARCRYSGKDLSLLLMRIRHAASARALDALAAAADGGDRGGDGDAADGLALTAADVSEALEDYVPASMAGVKTEKADVSFADVGAAGGRGNATAHRPRPRLRRRRLGRLRCAALRCGVGSGLVCREPRRAAPRRAAPGSRGFRR
jgi:hypothetical protein